MHAKVVQTKHERHHVCQQQHTLMLLNRVNGQKVALCMATTGGRIQVLLGHMHIGTKSIVSSRVMSQAGRTSVQSNPPTSPHLHSLFSHYLGNVIITGKRLPLLYNPCWGRVECAHTPLLSTYLKEGGVVTHTLLTIALTPSMRPKLGTLKEV